MRAGARPLARAHSALGLGQEMSGCRLLQAGTSHAGIQADGDRRRLTAPRAGGAAAAAQHSGEAAGGSQHCGLVAGQGVGRGAEGGLGRVRARALALAAGVAAAAGLQAVGHHH